MTVKATKQAAGDELVVRGHLGVIWVIFIECQVPNIANITNDAILVLLSAPLRRVGPSYPHQTILSILSVSYMI